MYYPIPKKSSSFSKFLSPLLVVVEEWWWWWWGGSGGGVGVGVGWGGRGGGGGEVGVVVVAGRVGVGVGCWCGGAVVGNSTLANIVWTTLAKSLLSTQDPCGPHRAPRNDAGSSSFQPVV